MQIHPFRFHVMCLLFLQALLLYLCFADMWSMRTTNTILLLLPALTLEIYGILYVMSVCSSEYKKGQVLASSISLLGFVVFVLTMTGCTIAYIEYPKSTSKYLITITFFVCCCLLSAYVYYNKTHIYLPISEDTVPGALYTSSSQSSIIHERSTSSLAPAKNDPDFTADYDHSSQKQNMTNYIYAENETQKNVYGIEPSDVIDYHVTDVPEQKKKAPFSAAHSVTIENGRYKRAYEHSQNKIVGLIMLQGLFVLLYFGPLNFNSRMDAVILVIPSIMLVSMYLLYALVDVYYMYSNKQIVRLHAEFALMMIGVLFILVCAPLYENQNYEPFLRSISLILLIIFGINLCVRFAVHMFHKRSPSTVTI